MEPGRPSATAFRVAMRRAAHQVLDEPRVLDDPIALRIIGSERVQQIRTEPRLYDSAFARRLRAFLVGRSRYAEDLLAVAVAGGVRQYVVLGAGLDTFAYRNPLGSLRVFEVDHPSTQAWKRELLEKTRIPVPANVSYVPVDFHTQTLGSEMPAHGFAPGEPAFFSWLGVTMYLEDAAVRGTLAWIAQTVPAGGVVFDYAIAKSRLNWFERWVWGAMAKRVAAVGEPWRATFDPRELVPAMHAMGYAAVEHLGPREMDARYFAGRSDRLRVGSLAAMVHGRIERPGP